MSFHKWLDSQYHQMAAEYKGVIRSYIRLWLAVVEGYERTAEAIDVLHRACASIEPPKLGKYPGEVSADDKAHFFTTRKPDWSRILQDELHSISGS